MGDEDEDGDENEALERFKTEFEPLSKWIKKELDEFVSDGTFLFFSFLWLSFSC